jgi:hypothetical protein
VETRGLSFLYFSGLRLRKEVVFSYRKIPRDEDLRKRFKGEFTWIGFIS